MPDPALPVPTFTDRKTIEARHTWHLSDIYADWSAWDAACTELSSQIAAFPTRQGTLAHGSEHLLDALRATDTLGQLAYKVYYFVALKHDEDQRDNEIGGRKQRVDHLLAQWAQATAWFNPEVLAIPIATVRGWLDTSAGLSTYRFALEELFRLQEHVLDEGGERILSLAARVDGTAHEVYEALSTADIRYPTITLSTGETVQITYGKYRALLEQCRVQADRASAFTALHETFAANANTYASLYNGVAQRDVFGARARNYPTTLDAALFANAIPPAVVETLIATTRAGTAPLQRYQRLRRQALGLDTYHLYDVQVPLVDHPATYHYDDVLDWIVESTRPLGDDYMARMRRAFEGRWIDVYENAGKRSGAYSAPVYGVHPYMLLNYNGTLDGGVHAGPRDGPLDAHACSSHEAQPFVYSGYTIFVAEVPSTLSEALLLELHAVAHQRPARTHRPAAARDRRDRRHVLHAGDVRRLGTAGAPGRRGGRSDHRGVAGRSLHGHAPGLPRHLDRLRRALARRRGRASRTFSDRRSTCTSTPRATPRRRSWSPGSRAARRSSAARPSAGISICCVPAAATTR